MIVKKITTSKTAAPKSKAANVRALLDYIAGPVAGGAGGKVEDRGALNLLNIDHDGQVQEIVDLAEVARRCPQPVQHWIMSWRDGEQPTHAQANEVVRIFLGEMGLGAHQAIYALHRDTHNWHVHLAVNRVHPATERVVTVNKGFDREIAHQAIARIEQRQGWEREAHGVYAAGADGHVERLQPRDSGDRQPSARARDFEERAGRRSAERIAIEEAASIVRKAGSWRDLHAALLATGMRYEKKGSGAILWVGDQPVKASAAGRDCSMAALRKRLGEFEPTPGGTVEAPGRARAIDPSAPTLREYLDERRKHHAERTRARDQQRREWLQLAERHREQRATVFRGSWRGKGDLLNATRSVLAARQAQEKAAIRERHQLEQAVLRREQVRFLSYEDWLRRRDRDEADRWRHRDRRPATIEGATFEQPMPRDIRAFTGVVDGWKVHYRLAGSRRGRAFTDRGKTIDIYECRSRETVLAALQLSAQKWGTISVQGNEPFLRICVSLAAEYGFNVANPELQDAIGAERERRRQMKIPDTGGRDEGLPQESLAPATSYRRHLADITPQSPGPRRVDPSRLDAEVALRMAVTGHSPEQIAKALGDGARAQRPDEGRDWPAYALRATQYAFSPPGERLRTELEKHRDRFLRIEGRQDENELLRRLRGPLRHL